MVGDDSKFNIYSPWSSSLVPTDPFFFSWSVFAAECVLYRLLVLDWTSLTEHSRRLSLELDQDSWNSDFYLKLWLFLQRQQNSSNTYSPL